MAFLYTYYFQYFHTPTPPSIKFRKNFFFKRSKRLGYENWIGGWGVCDLWKNNVLILLISSQELFSVDDDAIHDVIIQEHVWKWCHNYMSSINRLTGGVILVHFWQPDRGSSECTFDLERVQCRFDPDALGKPVWTGSHRVFCTQCRGFP